MKPSWGGYPAESEEAMRTIKINKDNLKITTPSEILVIDSENGSGLYKATNEAGEVVYMTRSEIKSICDINLIDETLDMLRNYKYDRIYTDDMMNFIDENEYNNLEEEWKKEYYQVVFEVENE